MPAAASLSALDRLRKAANLEPAKKEVELSDGSIFEMWVTPLTMAERERAQKQAKSEDAGAFALQLLIGKACDENGTKLFKLGEIDILKNEVKDKDLQSLMLAILTDDSEELDTKSAGGPAPQGQLPHAPVLRCQRAGANAERASRPDDRHGNPRLERLLQYPSRRGAQSRRKGKTRPPLTGGFFTAYTGKTSQMTCGKLRRGSKPKRCRNSPP